jgi:hypothetical protein
MVSLVLATLFAFPVAMVAVSADSLEPLPLHAHSNPRPANSGIKNFVFMVFFVWFLFLPGSVKKGPKRRL